MSSVRRGTIAMTCVLAMGAGIAGQTPQPFPRGGQAPPRTVQPTPPPPSSAQPAAPQPAIPDARSAEPGAPTQAQLGFPLYPTAQFIASYDAGRGQRYYLFGSSAPFADMVTYYRTSLKEKGNLVFEQPPTHVFEVGKFRDESMAFPPGVTVKDFTWGGSAGYPNPRRGVQPERFATIIQIVPAPGVPPGSAR